MSGSAWRALMLCFCAAFIAQEAATIPLTLNSVAVTGVTVTRAVAPFEWRIDVVRGSPADEAGLRSGDILDARNVSPTERFRLWSGFWKFGQSVRLVLVRRGERRNVFLTPSHASFDWALSLAVAAGFWSGLCAIVLVWRKAEAREVRLIVFWLLTVRLSIQMAPGNWVTASAPADVVNAAIGTLMLCGWALLATYATSFPGGHSLILRGLKALTYALAAFTAITQTLAVLAAWYGFTDPVGGIFSAGISQGLETAYFIAPVACAILVLARSNGGNRERLAWVFGPTSVYYLIGIAYFLPPQLYPVLQTPLAETLFLVLQLLAPLGLTYAMLNRRLLDVGFVLNRAAVYAGVSVVIIGLFVLAEWALGSWFSSATHTESLLLSALLALVLGLSVRALHHRVDLVLDNIFFRKRHEDEQAIRRFAREAPYITNPSILIERTIGVLKEHTGASLVRFEVASESGCFGGVDANDEAIVALHASHQPLDLGTVHSSLAGEFAYPLVARGRLLGVLVLGANRSGESYAPDESAAIEQLAQSVGGALDYLSVRDGSEPDGLITEMRALRSALTAATERFNAAASRLASIAEGTITKAE